MRKQFTIYREFLDLINILNEKEQEQLMLKIVKYGFDEKDIPKGLNKRQQAVFDNLKRPIDKYRSKSKNANSRWYKDNENETKNTKECTKEDAKEYAKEDAKEYAKEYAKEDTKEYTNINAKQEQQQDVFVIVNNNKNNIKDIIEFIEKNYSKTISSYEYEQINLLVNTYGCEIVYYAFEKTLDAGKSSLNYTKGILNNWKTDNLTTLEMIKEKEINSIGKNKSSPEPNWLNNEIKVDNNERIINEELKDFLEDFRSKNENS